MNIETICVKLISAIRDAGYNESTITNYNGVIRRFKKFCNERNVLEYSCDIGKQYAEDVISKKTRSFSLNRYHTQGRFIRLIDSYYNNGCLDFSMPKRGKIAPDNSMHKAIYAEYQKYLHGIYDNENIVHFYEYGMDCLLQFIKETKQTRQREVLCELRCVFRYLERTDLLTAIAGIHAPRIKRIIPILSKEEN